MTTSRLAAVKMEVLVQGTPTLRAATVKAEMLVFGVPKLDVAAVKMEILVPMAAATVTGAKRKLITVSS